MKTIYKFCSILTFLILCIAVSFNASAEDFEFETSLVHEVSKQLTPTAAVDCDGNSTPATPINYTAIEVLKTPDDFTAVSFQVYYSDNMTTPVYSYLNLTPAQVNFNSTTGEISYVMTGITQTRKELKARVYLNATGTGTVFEEKVFYTSQANPNPPIGTIIPFYGTAATAAGLELAGWFLCDGRTIASISDDVLFTAEKSALQTVIGSANLPDLRGLFLRGIDPAGGNQYDPDADRAVGNVQTNGFAAHTHDYDKSNTPTGDHNVTLSTTPIDVSDDGNNQVSVLQSASLNNGNHSHTIGYTNTATSSTGGGLSETRPVNAAVNYLIKVRY